MKKVIKVEIKDLKIARNMLKLAGYYEADSMTDEEVFEHIMSMIETYGAEWKVYNHEE